MSTRCLFVVVLTMCVCVCSLVVLMVVKESMVHVMVVVVVGGQDVCFASSRNVCLAMASANSGRHSYCSADCMKVLRV